MQLRDRTAGFVRTEGGLLPPDLLERIRALDGQLPFLDPASYDLERGDRFGEAITRSWNRLIGAWATFNDELAKLPDTDAATRPTRERWLLPLLEELGYGRLSPTKAVEIDGKSYPVSHALETIPLHLVGVNVPLDRRSRGVAGAAGQSPHGLLQEFLNRTSDRLWGIVSNGRTLRLLRDNASLTRQAYVEFDLEAIFSEEAYADFALLWHLAHRSRLEARPAEGAEEGAAPTAHGAILERWSKIAADTGARARDRLRDGVQEAIEVLGSGFLGHSANGELRASLQAGELDTQDYYRQLLRLVYRLILLFVAEDRDLLLDPKAGAPTRERYTRYYSTARLRRLAGRRKGSRHADLYAGLRVVVTALGSDGGAPGIGLPPLGGFLFGAEGCPHLDGAELANADLLDAIRKLATIEERGVLRAVDYRNLGSEELGSIYESLLELHPELDVNAGTFALRTAAGHERKTTGSYYTPSSLISVLLDSALDPVLNEAATKPTPEEAERAILELSVVDPAAGSGHFLVAAAHRIAKRLASVRSGDEEPAPEAIRTSLRDVISHCLYAVDINPMAVELCKVSLWLEALEPGKPLTFLDSHIKCGNSLLGTTPALVDGGVPNGAFTPVADDDAAVVRQLRRANEAERGGQQSFEEWSLVSTVSVLPTRAAAIEGQPDETLADVEAKRTAHEQLLTSSEYRRARIAADTWCAAFAAPKRPDSVAITTATVRAAARDGASLAPDVRRVVREVADEARFFHWSLEFPQIDQKGGFDVVIGNPPWERVKLQEKEFFAERDPAVASARNAAERKRAIGRLKTSNPPLWQVFQRALRVAIGASSLLRASSNYPLTARGDINTYAVFSELAYNLTAARGSAGLIVPIGIATDDTTKQFFGALVDGERLISLYGFENEEFLFPGVHHSTKFCLLTVAGARDPDHAATFVFFARAPEHTSDEARRFSLSAEQLRLLNPNTRTCPIFRTRLDASITESVYRKLPVLIREDPPANPWAITMGEMVHMANDSGLFVDREFDHGVPLYEAKMFTILDHRLGTYRGQSQAQANQGTLPRLSDAEKRLPTTRVEPRYWFPRRELDDRLEPWGEDWLLAWRKITAAVDWRTFVPTALPRLAVANSAIAGTVSRGSAACLLGNLSTYVFDYVARQKLGGSNMASYITKQLPVLPPEAYDESPSWDRVRLGEWVRAYVVELTATSEDMLPFARAAGWRGGPFVFDQSRRAQLFAELNAAYFLLYGLEREHVQHVMDSFWVVRKRDESDHGEYRTKRLILRAYEDMGAATNLAPFIPALKPLPGDSSMAHSPGHWVSWEQLLEGDRTTSRGRGGDGSRRQPSDSIRGGPASPSANPQDATPFGSHNGSSDNDGWIAEAAVNRTSLVVGGKVRHRSHGEGTILGVRETNQSVSLLVRFNDVEREIAFGYGVLDFQIEA